MSYIIEVRRQEHCNIEKLLRVLERELSVFDRGDRPDYDIVLAVINYFRNYPNACHHPKEEMVLDRINDHDPVAAANFGDLEAQHREGAIRLQRVAEVIERVMRDEYLLRQSVAAIIRQLIDEERRHIALEERVVFPAAALEALRPKDWANIALRPAERSAPFYQPGLKKSSTGSGEQSSRRKSRRRQSRPDCRRRLPSKARVMAEIARSIGRHFPCYGSKRGHATLAQFEIGRGARATR